MGILERFGLSRSRLESLSTPINLGVVSPWQEGSLSQIVLSELVGLEVMSSLPLSREDAMMIPAVSKARNLLVSSISKFPLRAYTDKLDSSGNAVPVSEQPAWMYRTNGAVSPLERMACTVDDGIFYGRSLWLTERGEADSSGRRTIINAEYCPFNEWEIKEGKILVNNKEADEDDVVLFNFPTEGLLVEGRRTIRAARDTETAWAGRMRNPIPLIELRITDGANITQTEADDYVKAWSAARRAENGAVGFTPEGMEIHVHGEVKADLYEGARNAIRTDIGSFVNVRASMLDGTMGVDSLTYKTEQGERNQFYEFDLPFYSDPIEARLSQDDILPRGQRARFDKYELYAPTPTPTGAPVED